MNLLFVFVFSINLYANIGFPLREKPQFYFVFFFFFVSMKPILDYSLDSLQIPKAANRWAQIELFFGLLLKSNWTSWQPRITSMDLL